MRADDIRAMVLRANEQALAQVDQLRGVPGIDEQEVDQYRDALSGVAEFWRLATPAFCHAWFTATAEGEQ